MKKSASLLRLAIMLLCAYSVTPYVFGSEWSYINEGGDWARKDAQAAEQLERLREQAEAVRIKIAENPVANESAQEAVTRIIMAESQALEQERQKIQQERQAREDAELAETLKISSEQDELENRQRAQREEQVRQQRAEQERQEREEQIRLEREHAIAQEKALAEQKAAQEKERIKIAEQADRAQKEKIAQEQRQQDREAKALADALREVQEFEAKESQANKPQTPAPKPLSRQELEDKELADAFEQSKAMGNTPKSNLLSEAELAETNKQLEKFEQAAYEQELKESAPFFQAYEQAISPKNMPRINIIRPEVIQQKKLECGYFSAINGALMYNAFRSLTPNGLGSVLTKLKNSEEIEPLLKQAQDALGCVPTLEASDIVTILENYKIPLDGTYSIYYEQLPGDITKLDRSNKEIVTVLEKLQTQKGFTHLFFLRKSGAHVGQSSLGHWISVVANNNDNKSIDLYVLDSQYPQSDSTSDRNHRMNHDKIWQALAILVHETGEKLRAEQPD